MAILGFEGSSSNERLAANCEPGMEAAEDNCRPLVRHDTLGRRSLRYRYLAVKNLINDEDCTSVAEPEKWGSIINQVENLHKLVIVTWAFCGAGHSFRNRSVLVWPSDPGTAIEASLVDGQRREVAAAEAFSAAQPSARYRSVHRAVILSAVQKPREQVADAEALLGVTKSLRMLVKSQINDGISPSEFINGLLKTFGQKGTPDRNSSYSMISWKDIGLAVSHMFMKAPECHTMMGPIHNTLKQRKIATRKKRTMPIEQSQPVELSQIEPERKKDTVKNMLIMFNVLRRNRNVRFENLVLNRISFAQTVENIFALSFLVKDGRAEIKIDDAGGLLVSPRNAPLPDPDNPGGVAYHHFILRFDFKDWKLMLDVVTANEELMPCRSSYSSSCFI